jgi:hypothetical protein
VPSSIWQTRSAISPAAISSRISASAKSSSPAPPCASGPAYHPIGVPS